MLKKSMRILTVLMVVIVALSAVSMVFAEVDYYLDGTGKYDPHSTKSDAADKVGEVMNTILGIVQVVGIALAVIMLIVLAIKYISSAPNDKAEIKKHAVVYVVGAVLLFASAGVIELLKNFAGIFNGDASGNSGTIKGVN